jgi:phage major head subunit gpT-like protein
MSNPTLTQTARALFNSTDGNAATGKALARATLSEMIARLLKVKDGDATLNLKMTHLVVPPDLMDLAIQLCYSANLSNDSGTPRTTASPKTDARSKSTTSKVLAEFLWSEPRP